MKATYTFSSEYLTKSSECIIISIFFFALADETIKSRSALWTSKFITIITS